MSVQAIAEALELSAVEASLVCDSLERDGLVQPAPSDPSQGEASYAITAMGEAVLYKVEHGAY
jgi:DNA-binding IclR family transcriptional regulator